MSLLVSKYANSKECDSLSRFAFARVTAVNIYARQNDGKGVIELIKADGSTASFVSNA